jgi:hypothetical protein
MDGKLIIEQIIIKDGPKEVFIISAIKKEEVKCQNGLALEAGKRTKINVTFRQVSHFAPKENKGFGFFFAGLLSKKMIKSEKIIINIIVIINGNKVEKPATCTLKSDVEPNGGISQGDFDCDVPLETTEFSQVNFTDPNSITISENNEEVSGIDNIDSDQSSPIAIDASIEEMKKIRLIFQIVLLFLLWS